MDPLGESTPAEPGIWRLREDSFRSISAALDADDGEGDTIASMECKCSALLAALIIMLSKLKDADPLLRLFFFGFFGMTRALRIRLLSSSSRGLRNCFRLGEGVTA
jgi:hypothetical protein